MDLKEICLPILEKRIQAKEYVKLDKRLQTNLTKQFDLIHAKDAKDVTEEKEVVVNG